FSFHFVALSASMLGTLVNRTKRTRTAPALLFVALAGFFLFGPDNVRGAAGKLLDGGFESSTPNGAVPDSGFWRPASAGAGAAAICTTTAGRSGNATTTNGLWTFTGASSNDWWSAPYQETPTYTGRTFTASAWIRTPQ